MHKRTAFLTSYDMENINVNGCISNVTKRGKSFCKIHNNSDQPISINAHQPVAYACLFKDMVYNINDSSVNDFIDCISESVNDTIKVKNESDII